MLKTINTVGKFIGLAVKYYALILVIAKAWDMISTEVKKIHAKDTEDDAT